MVVEGAGRSKRAGEVISRLAGVVSCSSSVGVVTAGRKVILGVVGRLAVVGKVLLFWEAVPVSLLPWAC